MERGLSFYESPCFLSDVCKVSTLLDHTASLLSTPPTSFCCVIPFISVSSFSSDPFSFHNEAVDEELVYSLTVKTSSGQMPLLALWGNGGP